MSRLRLLARCLLFGGLGGLLAAALAVAWLAERVLEAPLEPLSIDSAFTLEVASGSTAHAVLSRLEREGRLRQAWRMRLWLRWRGQGDHIQAGEYRFRPGTTALGLLDDLRHGRVLRHEVLLIEGWRFTQVRAALAAHPVLLHDSAGLDDAALMAAIGAPGRSPEGRFFPDTYAFVRGDGELAVLRRANLRLEAELQAAWSKRDESVDAVLNGPEEALILASLVEKETAAAAERPLIAGVFLRRLALGMRLQTDPTVIFGLGAAFDGDLRRSHLEADTPYNTYTRAGLPPTPIALVGRAALEAAVRPTAGEALYFVARGDGTHAFSDSYDQHLKFVRKFQRGRRPTVEAVGTATGSRSAASAGQLESPVGDAAAAPAGQPGSAVGDAAAAPASQPGSPVDDAAAAPASQPGPPGGDAAAASTGQPGSAVGDAAAQGAP